MESMFEYYRIKMSFQKETETGGIENTKTEELVMATCYTDAEKITTALMEDRQQFGIPSYEIIKTKIQDILFNNVLSVDRTLKCGLVTYYFNESEESEVGLYVVSVVLNYIDEKTGKPKPQKSSIYVPAHTPQEAIVFANQYIEDENVGFESYVTRTVKYDKAQSILVTQEKYKQNTNA